MQECYQQIRILELSDRDYLPRPTDGMLASFEQAHGFLLPNSYRKFVQHFGAGELVGLWSIASPMPAQDQFELGEYNSGRHGLPEERLLQSYGPEEFTSSFFFFADDGDHFFGWKLDETTDPQENEYAIYEFGCITELPRYAGSFGELVGRALAQCREWEPEPKFTRFEQGITFK